eukprot:PLAT15820.2.p2 GENE.PLAT15820.2~~PLAT15820.2.p2  ORF type:complete len:101 (+),score=40.31 PLAT15820.2:38-340(+)
MGIMTIICSVAFLLRAALLLVVSLLPSDRFSTNPVVLILYYGMLELFPYAVVLYYNRRLPPKAVSLLGGGGEEEWAVNSYQTMGLAISEDDSDVFLDTSK